MVYSLGYLERGITQRCVSIELFRYLRLIFAQKLAKLLVRLNAQQPPSPGSVSGISDKFDSLIIIDRRVDMITPMLTQLTYEGLIDEFLSIKNCSYPSLTSSSAMVLTSCCFQPMFSSQQHWLRPLRLVRRQDKPRQAHQLLVQLLYRLRRRRNISFPVPPIRCLAS